MTVRQTLAEMRGLMKKRGELVMDLERARNAGEGTGGKLDGMPKAAMLESKVERYGTYCAELSQQIDTIDKKLALYRDDVRPSIEAVPMGSERESMWLRYIEFLPVRQVAKKMHYEREAMYTLLKNVEEKWIF